MEGEHTIHALRRKRAEVSGQVVRAEEALAQLRADLLHVDAVLRMFDPDADPDAIKPLRDAIRSEFFAPNELNRLVLQLIRHRGPISTPDLCRAVMVAKEYDPNDTPLYTTIMKRLRARLGKLLAKRLVAREWDDQGFAVWRIGG